MKKLKLRLPAAFGNMVKSHKHQIENVNPMGTRTNGPGWVTVLLHWTSFVFLKWDREIIIMMTRK